MSNLTLWIGITRFIMYVGLQYHLQNNDMVFILVINMQGVRSCSIHSTKGEMTQ
jgi:hypothetical protein